MQRQVASCMKPGQSKSKEMPKTAPNRAKTGAPGQDGEGFSRPTSPLRTGGFGSAALGAHARPPSNLMSCRRRPSGAPRRNLRWLPRDPSIVGRQKKTAAYIRVLSAE
jgi:hypothetical protein